MGQGGVGWKRDGIGRGGNSIVCDWVELGWVRHGLGWGGGGLGWVGVEM